MGVGMYESFEEAVALTVELSLIHIFLFVVIIFAVIFTVVLSKTTFGRSVYAIGSNGLAAYYSGIHVQKIRLIIYMAMGFMAGLAALFLTSVLYGANTCLLYTSRCV